MALITIIRDLHRRKARERRVLALAEGVRLVEEMVAAGAHCKGAVISPSLEATPRGAALRRRLESSGVAIEAIGDSALQEIASTEHPQGVIAVYEPREWTLDDVAPAPRRPLIVLDAVQDPGNVGTIARTALAFGASGIVALPGTADLTSPKTVRAAMGALFRLPHLHAEDAALLGSLAARHVPLWATSVDGEALETLDAGSAVALVFGNEGAGVRPEVIRGAAKTVRISIRPEAESLNVAVAAGIMLHHMVHPGGRIA